MFGKNSAGSNDPQNKNSKQDEKINLSADDFQIDDLPIHTMRKDLAELKNPSSKKIPIKPDTVTKNSLFAQKPKVATLENNGPFFKKEAFQPQEKSQTYTPKAQEIKNKPLYFDKAKEIPQVKNNLPNIPQKKQEETSSGLFSFFGKKKKEETPQPNPKPIEKQKSAPIYFDQAKEMPQIKKPTQDISPANNVSPSKISWFGNTKEKNKREEAPIPKQNLPRETSNNLTTSNLTTSPKVVSNVIEKKEIIPPAQNQPKKVIETPANKLETPSHGIGKAIVIAIIIFIIIITGAGGYYFWMTRIYIVPEETITTKLIAPEIGVENEIIIDETAIMPELSSQNSNYLAINLLSVTPENLKKTLNDYADKVLKTNTIGIFEFLVTDENNTPIVFRDFATILGLELPQNILSQIGPDFSFYIYNYGNKTRFGLSISTDNEDQLKQSLLIAESELTQNFSPLYPEVDYTLPLTTFTGATYSGTPTTSIRYINITDSEDLTLDYAILNNQLIIGTTKSTAYSILDKLMQESL